MDITPHKLSEFITAVVKAVTSKPTRPGASEFGDSFGREQTDEDIALKDFTESLSEDERKDILALKWLGGGKGFDSFQQARAHTATTHDVAFEIRSSPHLAVYSIINGLSIQTK